VPRAGEGFGTMPGGTGLSGRRIAIVLVALAAVLVVPAVLPLPAGVARACSFAVYLAVTASALVACALAILHVPDRARTTWRLAAATVALLLLGEVGWIYWELTTGALPHTLGLYHPFFTASFVPLTILAGRMLAQRLAPAEPLSRARYVIDTLLGALSVSIVVVVVMLRPLYGPRVGVGGVAAFLTALYPVLDAFVLAMLLAAYLATDVRARARWEMMLAAGIACFAAGDLVFNYFFVAGSFGTGSPASNALGVAWLMGLALIGLSALTAVEEPGVAAAAAFAHPRVTEIRMGSLAPAIASLLLIPVLLYLARYQASDDLEYWGIMLAATGLILLLVARGGVMLAESRALQAYSVTDPVTGVFNHRRFYELIDQEAGRAVKRREPLSIALIDIDDFSSYNDAYGHDAGDARLSQIASWIEMALPSEAMLCRVEADTFGLILPRTTDVDAHRVCRAIARQLAADTPEDEPRTTASMGITMLGEDSPDVPSLVHHAEGALYWAKLRGNEIVIYDDRVVSFLGPEERIVQVEQQAQIRTVQALAAAVDARDAYTHSHSRNVATRAVELGRREGLDPDHLHLLEMAALLHDVGKIGVPDGILRKPDRLSEADLDMIRDHPVLGEQILDSTALKEILPWVLSHHERWDGTGYPAGLKGEHIPLEARIIAICDAYDAMTSERPYRGAMDAEVALAEITGNAGTQFDPRLAREFADAVGQEAPSSGFEPVPEPAS
jgi:diguanylate cyclase (GGDEF)-like protein